MAFIPENLALAVDTIGGGNLRIHFYETADVSSVVLGANYFSDGKKRGLRANDLLVVSDGVTNYVARMTSPTTAIVDPDFMPPANQADAETGTSNLVGMTPLRTHQAIAARTQNGVIGGRLSLSNIVAVTEADVVGATAVHLIPMGNDATLIYDGSIFQVRTFDPVSVTLSAGLQGANSSFDVFDYWTGSAVALGVGPGWSSLTVRGTGGGTTELEAFHGRLVNKVQILLWNGTASVLVPARQATFRGSFHCTAAGQTEDSLTKRFLSNMHNPARRPLLRQETSPPWNYSTASFVLANNGNGNNRVRYLHCVAGRPVEARAVSVAYDSTTGVKVAFVAIGIDQTTVQNNQFYDELVMVDNLSARGWAEYLGSPGLGVHDVNWLEKGAGSGGQVFSALGAGIRAWVEN